MADVIDRLLNRLEEREALLVLAAVFGLFATVEAGGRGDQSGIGVGTGMLLGLCATVPLAVLATHSIVAGLTVTLANVLLISSDQPPYVAGLLSQLIAGYWIGRYRKRRYFVPLVVPFAMLAIGKPGPGTTILLFIVISTVILGAGARERREEVAREEVSQATADTLLEHAARGERARIARELHDVVAHHISMIAVQAETARLTTPGMPAEGAKRLVAIGDTARTALTEMRRLLGVLREDTAGPPARAPQPGLEQLNELVDEARDSSGASTRLIVHGPVVPLDPGVQLTAYRIVQEALTNARRHASGAAVDVELEYTEMDLRVRVRDNGPGPASEGEGHGLLGMRERAGMVGGTLSVGRSPGGGFLVEAVLPTPVAAAWAGASASSTPEGEGG